MKKLLVDTRYRSHLRITHSTDFLEADEGHATVIGDGMPVAQYQTGNQRGALRQTAGRNNCMNEISINLALQEMNTMLANLREPKRLS